MRLVDTHVHLNFSDFEGRLSQVAAQWRSAGVGYLIHSCVEPQEFKEIQAIANQLPQELSFAVGLHPLDAEKWTSDMAQQITDHAQSDERVVAIGEMGLDFFKATNHEQQGQVFEAQLKIAHHLGLPVIIHCRDAAQVMAEQMRQFWQDYGSVNGVMHCWSGTPEETEWFLELGMYISFSGILTFANKSAAHVKESARMVPLDRLLVETDCPFLSPVPHRGERPNQPAYVRYVAETLADVRGMTLEAIAQQTSQNACTLFNVALPDLTESEVTE